MDNWVPAPCNQIIHKIVYEHFAGLSMGRLPGLDSDNGGELLEELNRVYELLRPYVNFFQPVMKLVTKTRHGAKVHKVYDMARTPYQRLLEAGVLTEAKQQELAAIYHGLNPISLLAQINQNLEPCGLWQNAPTSRLKPELPIDATRTEKQLAWELR